MAEFFEMGGYAAYVWPAYGAMALVLIALIARTVARNAAVRKELVRVETRARDRRRDG